LVFLGDDLPSSLPFKACHDHFSGTESWRRMLLIIAASLGAIIAGLIVGLSYYRSDWSRSKMLLVAIMLLPLAILALSFLAFVLLPFPADG
jgi:uncharacterized membrane protein YoaK (UPF0700 family)